MRFIVRSWEAAVHKMNRGYHTVARSDGGFPFENLTLIRNLMINNNIFNDYYLTICGIIFNDIHDSCKH
jgi:hypothetical protein